MKKQTTKSAKSSLRPSPAEEIPNSPSTAEESFEEETDDKRKPAKRPRKEKDANKKKKEKKEKPKGQIIDIGESTAVVETSINASDLDDVVALDTQEPNSPELPLGDQPSSLELQVAELPSSPRIPRRRYQALELPDFDDDDLLADTRGIVSTALQTINNDVSFCSLVKAEIDRRRIQRIKQVREQEKAFALKVRQNVKNKRDNELKLLADQLKDQWKEQQSVKQSDLEQKYKENLQELGDGHYSAFKDEEDIKKDHRKQTVEEEKRALERHNKAMLDLLLERAQNQHADLERADARTRAMDTERARAAHMASLPKPKDLIMNFDLTKMTQVQQPHPRNAEDFRSTHYHLQPVIHVEREQQDEQIDAREAAEEVGEIIDNVIEDAHRSQAEQAEKARLRHKHAMAQLHLQEDHKKLMTELGHLERTDRQRRQEAVARIPVKIFQPPHKRIEDAEERQRDLEQAFEDMYMIQTGYTGDLTIALEPSVAGPSTLPEEHLLTEAVGKAPPNPQPTVMPAVPRDESSEEDDEGHQERKIRPTVDGRDGKKQAPAKKPKAASAAAPKAGDPVRRLLGRIQNQREEWRKRQATESAEDKDRRAKKVSSLPPARRPKESRVHVLTPLPEEDELQKSRDSISSSPSVPQQPAPERDVPRPMAPVRDIPHDADGSSPGPGGVRMLLHPYEVAQQARAGTPTDIPDQHMEPAIIKPVEPEPSQPSEPKPSATTLSDEQHLLEQQRLKLQLQEQKLMQQRLEEQIKQYQTQLHDLHTPYDDSGLGTGVPPIPDRSCGRISEGAVTRRDHEVDMLPGDVVAIERSVREGAADGERSEGSVTESGSVSLVEQTASELETSESASQASEPYISHPRIPSDISSIGPPEHRPGYRHDEDTTPSAEHPGRSSSGTISDASSEASSAKPESGSCGALPAWRSFPLRKSPQTTLEGFSTTGDTLPRGTYSESQGTEDMVSEELSSSTGSLTTVSDNVISRAPYAKAEESIDAVLRANRDLSYPQASTATRSGLSATDTNYPQASTATRSGLSATDTNYVVPFSRDASPMTSLAWSKPPVRQPSTIQYAPPLPRARSPLSDYPTGSPSYLKVYRKKWEDERKLIEAQRQEIRERQEKQARRMRYYQNVIDRYGRISPQLPSTLPQLGPAPQGTQIISTDSKIDTSSINGAESSDSPSTLGDFLGRYRESLGLDEREKESSSVYANVQPSSSGLRRGSSASDESNVKSMPGQGMSDYSMKGTSMEEKSRMASSSSSKSKSTSTGEFSLPSTGTEYYQFPHSIEDSNGTGGETRSSVTTLSELTERLTRLTSTSESGSENGIPRGSKFGPSLSQSGYPGYEWLKEREPMRTEQVLTELQDGVPQASSSGPSGITSRTSLSQWLQDHPVKDKLSEPGSQQWFIPAVESKSSVASLEQQVEQKSSEGLGQDLIRRAPEDQSADVAINQQWFIPPRGSTHSLRSADERVSITDENQTIGDSSFQRTATSSHGDIWHVPSKDSIDSMKSFSSQESRELVSHLQGSQVQQWFVPPSSSVRSTESLGSESVSPSTRQWFRGALSSQSSQTQQWFVPQAASTHSLGSLRSKEFGEIGSSGSKGFGEVGFTRSKGLIQDTGSSPRDGSMAPYNVGPHSEQWVGPARDSTSSSCTTPTAFHKEIVGSSSDRDWYTQGPATSAGSRMYRSPATESTSGRSGRDSAGREAIPSSVGHFGASESMESSPAPSLTSASLASDFSLRLLETSESLTRKSGLPSDSASSALTAKDPHFGMAHEITQESTDQQGSSNLPRMLSDHEPISSEWDSSLHGSNNQVSRDSLNTISDSIQRDSLKISSISGEESSSGALYLQHSLPPAQDPSLDLSQTGEAGSSLSTQHDSWSTQGLIKHAYPSHISGSIHDASQHYSDQGSPVSPRNISYAEYLRSDNTSAEATSIETGSTGQTRSLELAHESRETGSTGYTGQTGEVLESAQLPLRDAFVRRKQEFIKKSLARVEKAKAKRYEVIPRVQAKGKVKPAKSTKKSGNAKTKPKKR